MGEQINQEDLDALLKQAQQGKAKSPPPPIEDSQTLSSQDIENLLKNKGGAKPAAASTPSSAPLAVAAKGDSSVDEAGKLLSQTDIEALLNNAGGGGPRPASKPAPRPRAAETEAEPAFAHGDVELLLRQAEAALASVDKPEPAGRSSASTFRFQSFEGAPPSNEEATLDLLRDVELDLRIELGRTNMQLEDVLRLRKGSVVALDKLAGDPVDIFVNGRLVAKGEVLVLNDNFCVRVGELISGELARAG